MANHKSALKRFRQSIKRRDRNRLVKTATRTALKKARVAIETGDKEAPTLVRYAESLIAKAATKGVINKGSSKRTISRLAGSLAASTK